MPKPVGYAWSYPGFFSLFVPYGETNDFFYSGHVGVSTIFFLEFYSTKWYKCAIYAAVVIVTEAFVLIATRTHYTIDVVAGGFFGHYFFILSERYSYLVDWYVFKIPLAKRMALDESEECKT